MNGFVTAPDHTHTVWAASGMSVYYGSEAPQGTDPSDLLQYSSSSNSWSFLAASGLCAQKKETSFFRRVFWVFLTYGATEDKTIRWHHRLNGHEFEQPPEDSEGQGSLVCCGPWGHKESDMT